MKSKTAKQKSSKSSRQKTIEKQDRKPTFTEIARRKQILDASQQLFSSQGYESTSIDDIVGELDVSRGVIFYYFDSKQEIGAEIFKNCLSRYGIYVRERVARKPAGMPQLIEFVSACLDYQDAHRDDYLLYIDLNICFRAKENYDLSILANSNTRAWLVDIIKAGQKSGDIRKLPARNLADIVQAVVDGLMELLALEPDEVNIPGCKKLLVQMLQSSLNTNA